MVSQKNLAVFLVCLLSSASCQPAPSPWLQAGLEEEGGTRQGGLLAAAILIPTLLRPILRPILNNVNRGFTNAIMATILGRELPLIPAEGISEPPSSGASSQPAPARKYLLQQDSRKQHRQKLLDEKSPSNLMGE